MALRILQDHLCILLHWVFPDGMVTARKNTKIWNLIFSLCFVQGLHSLAFDADRRGTRSRCSFPTR